MTDAGRGSIVQALSAARAELLAKRAKIDAAITGLESVLGMYAEPVSPGPAAVAAAEKPAPSVPATPRPPRSDPTAPWWKRILVIMEAEPQRAYIAREVAEDMERQGLAGNVRGADLRERVGVELANMIKKTPPPIVRVGEGSYRVKPVKGVTARKADDEE